MRTFKLLKEAHWPGTGFKVYPGTVIVLADDTPQNVIDKFAGYPEFWHEEKVTSKAGRKYVEDDGA